MPVARRRLRALVLYASGPSNRTVSYQQAWPRHFRTHPRFSCALVNLEDRTQRRLLALRALAQRPWFDVVVLLHSVFANDLHLSGRTREAVLRLRAPIAYFIANEYKDLPAKVGFAEELGVSLLVSQFTDERPLGLYRERLGVPVVGIPNSGIDPRVFAPRTPTDERPIDLGYRVYDAALYLGHSERSEMADFFLEHADRYGLKTDISLDPGARFEEAGWAAFLNRCKGQLGTEAGADFFELTDSMRNAVHAYLEERPDATLAEIRERFFRDYHNPVPGRALSSRIVEAAATKTVQILFEGAYGGYFEPGVHYIPLRKDFGNADEAVETFRDPAQRQRLAEAAYEVAVTELTYDRLIDRFRAALDEVL